MKNAFVLVMVLASSSLAFADKATENPACANIAKQCESAGFEPGEHKKDGKGLWVDCVEAIAKGKTVAGVSATADEAKACHVAHKAGSHKKK